MRFNTLPERFQSIQEGIRKNIIVDEYGIRAIAKNDTDENFLEQNGKKMRQETSNSIANNIHAVQ